MPQAASLPSHGPSCPVLGRTVSGTAHWHPLLQLSVLHWYLGMWIMPPVLEQGPRSIPGLSWAAGMRHCPHPRAASIHERVLSDALTGGSRSPLTMSLCACPPGINEPTSPSLVGTGCGPIFQRKGTAQQARAMQTMLDVGHYLLSVLPPPAWRLQLGARWGQTRHSSQGFSSLPIHPFMFIPCPSWEPGCTLGQPGQFALQRVNVPFTAVRNALVLAH